MQRNNVSLLKKCLPLLGLVSFMSAVLTEVNPSVQAQLLQPTETIELSQSPTYTLDPAVQFPEILTIPDDTLIPSVVEPAETSDEFSAYSDELQRFLIKFNDAYLVYEPGEPGLQIAAQSNVLSYGWDWEVVELKPYLYAFRQANWDGFYWKVNTSRKEVYRVTNGSFGELGGDQELLNMTVDTVGSPEAPERFTLDFVDAYLVRANDGVLQIATEGNVLSYGSDWEVVELQPYLFQLRQSVWKGFYWQVNTSREIAQRVNDDNFGQLSDRDRDDLDVQIEAVY